MTLFVDTEKGKQVAPLLYNAFRTTGILGRVDMPEDRPPAGVETGSRDHLLFLTLAVSLDYQRDAYALWESARRTYEDPATRYLFDPEAVHEASYAQVFADLKKHGLSKKHNDDTFIWRTVGISLSKKWGGDPQNFLADCGYDGPTVLRRLRDDRHLADGRMTPDFPFLRGKKIGPLWLRMLRDNAGLAALTNLESVPIPVDIHVARASLCLGIVRGTYEGRLEDIFEAIRQAWAESVKGHAAGGRPMIALDVDEPLWNLSRSGCGRRDRRTGLCPLREACEMGAYCVKGRVEIEGQRAVVETERSTPR
ncbi:hypothetical protein [Methanofollis ethanolicus]|uniref:hypothetical protein n=1 Tax=Methanofollis ethanolicus TaxID=488124 RepID=UPI0008371FB0|nr:hypothetical protein [Methanofollis ethanolicus]